MNELKKEYLNYLERTTGKRNNCIVSFFRKANDYEVENNIEIEKFKEEDIKNNAELKKALNAIGFSNGGEQSEQAEWIGT